MYLGLEDIESWTGRVNPKPVDAGAGGANLPRLNPGALAAFELPLPPLADQRRIATILQKADTLRAKRRATLALLDSLTSAVFRGMFGADLAIASKWPVRELTDLIVDGPQNGLYRRFTSTHCSHPSNTGHSAAISDAGPAFI